MSLSYHGDTSTIGSVHHTIETGRTLFALVLSYTRTCEIPGITVAGSNPDMLKYTPPADAEFIYSGRCLSIPGIPATPDGKPTPALLTRVALRESRTPHIAINAGGMITPQTPYIDTKMVAGDNIAESRAMTHLQAKRAISLGKEISRTFSELCDCMVLAESIPGGTTTALATLRGLGYQHKVSSSMPDNPVSLKEDVVGAALGRVRTDDPIEVAAAVSDPMILFLSGMISGAHDDTDIVLAGGTQMLAVLALSRKLCRRLPRIVLATTSYVADDPETNFYQQATDIVPDMPVASANPLLEKSVHPGLQAYANGFAKDGAGAGGSMFVSSTYYLYPDDLLPYVDDEYTKIMSSRMSAK